VARVVLAVPGATGRRLPLADLPDVRRAAASLLFDRSQGELDGVLAEDWPLLFS